MSFGIVNFVNGIMYSVIRPFLPRVFSSHSLHYISNMNVHNSYGKRLMYDGCLLLHHGPFMRGELVSSSPARPGSAHIMVSSTREAISTSCLIGTGVKHVPS